MLKKHPRIYLTNLNTSSVLKDLNSLAYDDGNHLKVKLLRNRYKLDALTAHSRSEFDTAFKLAKFVSKAWAHVGISPKLSKYDALTVLKKADQGYSFNCAVYSSVFVQLCHAVGIYARVIRITTKNPSLGISGHGHWSAEYWDNEFNKWVWLDPQLLVFAKRDGVPLNFNDFFISKKSRETKLIHKESPLELKILKNFFNRYGYSVTAGGEKFFFTKQDHKFHHTLLQKGAEKYLTFQGQAIPSTLFVEKEDFYKPVNESQLILQPTAPKTKLYWEGIEDYKIHFYKNFAKQKIRVLMKHNMPWFDKFEVEFNSQVKFTSREYIDIVLKEGTNHFSCTPINKFGRYGKSSEFTVRFDAKYKTVKDYW